MRDIVWIVVLIVAVVGEGLYWVPRPAKVITQRVEIEKIKYIDRQIRVNETRASNLIVEGRAMTNARNALERELGRMVLGRYFIDYTNNRNSQDRFMTERIDLLGQDKILLRTKVTIYSNASFMAVEKLRKTRMLAVGIGTGLTLITGVAILSRR